jgi:uncharacterized protein YndB with AHSA1/START domain
MAARSNSLETAGQDLVINRVFDAPRKLVFKVWTDPQHLARWWGPHGFTNPVCEVDLRPGGALRIDMRAPDGVVYPMTGVFQEVLEPERLVFTSAALDKKGNPMFEVLNTVVFGEKDGKTTLTVRARVLNASAAAAPHLQGMQVGWGQSLERLADLLNSTPVKTNKKTDIENDRATGAADREIAATRVFDAPRDLVWQMWTNSEHIAQWWGPKGFTNTIHEMDVRAGGVWRFIMHGPDGRDYPNKIVYVEILKPERLVYDHVSGPLFQATATFTQEGGKTRVDVRMVFESAKLRDQVAAEFGAVEGLHQTLGRLGEHLAKWTAER